MVQRTVKKVRTKKISKKVPRKKAPVQASGSQRGGGKTPVEENVPQTLKREPDTEKTSKVDVGTTFFSKHGSDVQPGATPSGLVLDRRLYIESDTDLDGTPVEYKWGSKRPGKPERNKVFGWVVALQKDRKLHPNGTPVVVGNMTLLVRQKEHGDLVRDRKYAEAKRAERSTKSNVDAEFGDAAAFAAKQAGLNPDDVLVKKETVHERYFEGHSQKE